MHKPKLMLIGLDSLPLSLLDNYAASCPAIRAQMRKGMTGHAIPCLPVWTPTNWATLATGAEAGATGATGWTRTLNGKEMSTFNRRAIGCDTIFDSVARAGMKSLAIQYPGSYPTRPGNMVIAPLHISLVSNAVVDGRILDLDWAKGDCARVSPAAKGRKKIHAWIHKHGRNWNLGLVADPAKAKFPLEHEKWSDPIVFTLPVKSTSGKCMCRVMVFDNGRRLAVTEVYDVGTLGAPASLCRKVLRELGPPVEHSTFEMASERDFGEGKIPSDTIMKLADKDMAEHVKWLADAAILAMKVSAYDVFYLHFHYPDSVLHAYLAASEGTKEYNAKQVRFAKKAVARGLKFCDDLVAKLLKLAGPKTTVLIVSDHGNVPNRFVFDVGKYLIKHGLITCDKKGKIDPRRSKVTAAANFGSVGAAVNAKEGSAKYCSIQQELIDCLLDWKTATGERVVAVALRKKDAQLMGYSGPTCPDVCWHYNSGFSWGAVPGGKLVAPCSVSSNHGPQMPVTFGKTSDNMSFFVLTGPGVKKGARWDEAPHGHVRLVDMLPTACEVAGVPPPLDVTGAVRRRMLLRG
jgi:hypothetical protein